MDIVSGLTAVGKALEIVRVLKDLEGQINGATFKIQIADLYSALADAKIALADAREELSSKDSEIAKLKTIRSTKKPVVSYRGFNFGLDENGDSVGRPFCPVCEQERDLQVQIMRATSTHDLCPKCQGIYSGYAWKLPSEHLPKNKEL